MNLVSISRDGNVNLPGISLPEAATAVITATVQLYARCGYAEPWVGYLAIEGGMCVGTCGFTAPPADGVAELAYFTFPDFEGRGMATRMVQRLLTLAQAGAPSVRIIAHTLTEENASNHILKKLGFAFSGTIDHPEDGKIWKWSYEPKLNHAKPS
jgi:RimJ/RimL family protein N-acetyltransferase